MATQTIKLSSRGQVVIPKTLRIAHRWKPGSGFIVEECEDGILLKPEGKRERLRWEKLIGCLQLQRPAQDNQGIERRRVGRGTAPQMIAAFCLERTNGTDPQAQAA